MGDLLSGLQNLLGIHPQQQAPQQRPAPIKTGPPGRNPIQQASNFVGHTFQAPIHQFEQGAGMVASPFVGALHGITRPIAAGLGGQGINPSQNPITKAVLGGNKIQSPKSELTNTVSGLGQSFNGPEIIGSGYAAATGKPFNPGGGDIAQNYMNKHVLPQSLPGALGSAVATGLSLTPGSLGVKPIAGAVERGVAKVAPDLAKATVGDVAKGAATANAKMGQAGFIKNPLPSEVPKPPTPSVAPVGQERGLIKSVKASPSVAPEVKKTVSSTPVKVKPMQPMVDKATAATSDLPAATEKTYRALSQTPGRLTDQQVIDAHTVAAAHSSAGNHAVAEDIYSKMAPHATRTAQGLHAYSVLSNLTPEGMHYKATNILRNGLGLKEGEAIPQKLSDKVAAHIQEISGTKPGSYARDISTQKLVNTVNNSLPRGISDAIFGIGRAGLISGPETVAKVATSYGVNTPGDLLSRPISAATDKLAALLQGHLTGGRSVTFNPSDVGTFVKGAARGVGAIPTKMVGNIDKPGTGGFKQEMGKGSKATGYEKVIMRMHGSLPKPVHAGTYDMNIREQARTEAINQGLKGADKKSFIQKTIASPTQKMKDIATLEAEKNTNMNATAAGAAASKVQGIPYIGKVIAPITRVPSALGTKGIVDMSPLGYAKAAKQLWNALPKTKGEFNQREFSTAVGKATTGTGIAAGGAYLMNQGRMSLATPSDPKQKALNLAQGIPNNSIYLGGTVTKNADGTNNYKGGTWISLNATGAAGITAGLGGSFQQGLDQKKGLVGASVQGGLGAAKLVADQPYLKGVSGFGQALSNPTQYGQVFMDNTAGMLVPGFVSQTARGIDPNQRAYPNNIPDTLASKIPGLRQTLAPQRDMYGKVVPGSNPSNTLGGGIVGTINPFYPSGSRNQGEQVTSELQRLYNAGIASGGKASGGFDSPAISQPTKAIGGTSGGKKTPATNSQIQNFIAKSGPIIQNGIKNLMASPNYAKLTDAQKSAQIDNIITEARKNASVNVLGKTLAKPTALDKVALSNPNSLGTTLKVSTSSKGKQTVTQSPGSTSSTDPNAKYQSNLDKYKQALASNPVTAYKMAPSLAKEAVTKNFSPDVNSLYAMSAKQINAFFNANPNQGQLQDQVKQLDSQLLKAGVISHSKFTTSSGKVAGAAKAPKAVKSTVKFGTSYTKLASLLKSTQRIKAPKGVKAPRVSLSKSATIKPTRKA